MEKQVEREREKGYIDRERERESILLNHFLTFSHNNTTNTHKTLTPTRFTLKV